MTKRLTISTRILALVGATSLLAGLAAPLEAGDHPSRGELLQQLIPVYQSLHSDPQYMALFDQAQTRSSDPGFRDRVLSYLPMSPLELLQVDMHLRRYEIAVPPFINESHRRWIQLRPDLARQHYGDEYVDGILRGAGAKPADGEANEVSPKADVGTNRNVAADFASSAPEEYQGEIQVAVNPSNPNQIVAGSNTMNDCGQGPTQAIFHSSDGGTTWGHTCSPGAAAYGMTCSQPLSPFVFGSDPAVWWDDAGAAHVEYMMICLDAIICSLFPDLCQMGMSIVVSKSTDGGATWSGQGVVKDSWATTDIEDKNFYAIDRYASSPYHGRHYSCWDRNNDEKVAYSSNGGASWTEADLPAAGSGTMDLGCELAVQKNGTVHVVFDTLTCGTSTCTNEQMFYSRSANGGASWSAPVMVQDFNLVSFSGANTPGAQDSRGINPFGAVDVDNSGGACDGYLYATFSDYATGGSAENSDVFVRRSTDNGATWGAAVRVNDDGAGGKIQFHPTLMVDQANGQLFVAWHDARNTGTNHAVDYFLARSLDCGLTFEANVQASQPSAEFNNSGISSSNENTTDNANANPNQYGEYMGLDVLGGSAYLAWLDSRHFYPGSTTNTQKENVGFAKVTFSVPPLICDIFCDGFETGNTSRWSATTP